MTLTISFLEYFSMGINRDLIVFSDVTCRIIPYLIRVIVSIPSWLHVFITFDRFFSVAYPTRFNFIRKKKIISAVILIMIILIAILNAENFFFHLVKTSTFINVTSENSTQVIETVINLCIPNEKFIQFWRDMTVITLRAFFPLFLMIVGNFLLIRILKKSKARFRLTVNKMSKSDISALKKEHNFAVSVLAMNALFLIFMLPLEVTITMADLFLYIPSLYTPTLSAGTTLAYHICIYLAICANSCAFFVTYKFNKVFHSQLFCWLREIGLVKSQASMKTGMSTALETPSASVAKNVRVQA